MILFPIRLKLSQIIIMNNDFPDMVNKLDQTIFIKL